MKLFKSLINSALLVVALATSFSSFAQEEESKGKPNVYVDYFSRPSSIPFEVAERLRSSFMEGILESNRADVIDVDAQPNLRIEEERRKNGVDADGDVERIQVMQQAGANFIITGLVTSATTAQKKYDSGEYYYDGAVTYTVKLINPNDGKTVVTKTIQHGGDKGISITALVESVKENTTGDTQADALAATCGNAKVAGKKFAKEAFPLFGRFLEADQIKGDKLESFYIDLGEVNGLAEKDKFEVCILREVAKRRSLKAVGECEVTAVEGDDIAHCKVKKGHKEIKAALDGGQTIVVRSKN